RYAEVLLNYAEAMNEAFGPEADGLGNGKTALWAVNEVRTRAQYPAKAEYLGQTGGMPPIASGLSKDEMREKIRHERRIELAFEEHRFWDVRRWMIDPATMVNIQAQIPVWQLDGTVKYEVRTIQTRVFETKMYRMPIPEQQIYTNPNLAQNPGWNYSPESAE
ncbi:MAG: RagB/SusD family nutrient uptake outer membrane protein, partial [Dysgonamonadaceae bacterium]|nr:RagB/SusD family nutrient uptake outer membrane protein [Dysgonamonadaceae bacterium]